MSSRKVAKILAFIEERNEVAHPFEWTTKPFDKVLRSADVTVKLAA